jgi:hypothetical protein
MTKVTMYKNYRIKQRGRTVVVEREDGDLVNISQVNGPFQLDWAKNVIDREISSPGLIKLKQNKS